MNNCTTGESDVSSDCMRAAIYSRFSSDLQKPTSTADQVAECRRYIEQRGWVVDDRHIFVDEAISGSVVDRSGYQSLKQAALDHEFDYIVVHDLSRLTRNLSESVMAFRDLTALGIYIVGVADGVDTSQASAKLSYLFRGITNEIFLDDLRDKVLRGLKGQVLRGYSAGGRIYGYKTEPDLDPNGALDKFGRPIRYGCRVVVDETEADIVRQIFRLRQSGMGWKAIARWLNERDIPPPRGPRKGGKSRGGWNPSSINSMVSNEKYRGVWRYNARKWVKQPDTGRRKPIDKPRNDTVVYESEKLRIVPDELWFSVNSPETKQRAQSHVGRKSYLLSGLLLCDRCGKTMVVQNSRGYSAYRCNTHRNQGLRVCDNCYYVPRAVVEQRLISDVRRLLLSQDVLRRATESANQWLQRLSDSGPGEIDRVTQRRDELRTEIDNLVEMAASGVQSNALRQRLEISESELERVERRLAELEARETLPSFVTPAEVSTELWELADLIGDETKDVMELRRLLSRMLPDKLRVDTVFEGNNRTYRILGGLLPMPRTGFRPPKMDLSGTGNRTPV